MNVIDVTPGLANGSAASSSMEFHKAGISTIPLRLDGSKAPSIGAWKEFQGRRATIGEILNWHSNGPIGEAVICGAISGGLEVLDFDHDAETVFPNWAAMVDSILCRLPVVETPGDGYHVYYRCPVICGNQKIANDGNQNVLIESRGEGGYVVSVTSPATVHSKNFPYVQVAGPALPAVPTITPDERIGLWRAARTFDQSKAIQAEKAKLLRRQASRRREYSDEPGKLTPWDDFNARGDWGDLLGRHGWTTHDGIFWRHPNAKSGHKHSATLRVAEGGDLVFCVFTTSTPLEAGKTHSLFSAMMALDHRGNIREALADLKRNGYGDR